MLFPWLKTRALLRHCSFHWKWKKWKGSWSKLAINSWIFENRPFYTWKLVKFLFHAMNFSSSPWMSSHWRETLSMQRIALWPSTGKSMHWREVLLAVIYKLSITAVENYYYYYFQSFFFLFNFLLTAGFTPTKDIIQLEGERGNADQQSVFSKTWTGDFCYLSFKIILLIWRNLEYSGIMNMHLISCCVVFSSVINVWEEESC